MKTAYLILTHKSPRQVGFLLKLLKSPRASFFVHIDRKVDRVDKFKEELNKYSEDICYVRRHSVYWGDFSLVAAMIELLRAAQSIGFDRYHFLSGQDLPIKASDVIDSIFKNDISYVEFFPMDEYSRWNGLWRVNQLHFPKYTINLNPGLRYKLDQGFAALSKISPRKIPLGLQPYGGSNWMSLNHYSATKVLQFIFDNPVIIDFFRYTHCPDEIIFQTILCNQIDHSRLYNDNFRFIDFPIGANNPREITEADRHALINSRKCFARKFDLEKNPYIGQIVEDIVGASEMVHHPKA